MEVRTATETFGPCGKATGNPARPAGALQVADGLFLAVPPQLGPAALDLLPRVAGYLMSVELLTDQVCIWPTNASAPPAVRVSKEAVMLCVPLEGLAEHARQADRTLLGLQATGRPSTRATVASFTRFLLECLAQGEQGRSIARTTAETLCLHLVASCGRTALRCDVTGGSRLAEAPRAEDRSAGLVEADQDAEHVPACDLSPGYVSRAFRCSTCEPPRQRLLPGRAEKAGELLQAVELQPAELTRAAGFSDQSRSDRSFAKVTGVTPGRWRKATRWI